MEMSNNPWLTMTLNDAVGEVLTITTGMDLSYIPELDRYRSITKTLNRALRLVATEVEWSYYSSLLDMGTQPAGTSNIQIPAQLRPRIISDDAVRLTDEDNCPIIWAYFLPRDALHKYNDRDGLWVAETNSTIRFSRPLRHSESCLKVMVPVMREPRMFTIPDKFESLDQLCGVAPPPGDTSEVLQLRNLHYPDKIEEWVFIPGLPPYENVSPEVALSAISDSTAIKNQQLDFAWPDLVVAKAVSLIAQADPVLQPRVQYLDDQYKNLMYQFKERDELHTDSPYMNEFNVPVLADVYDTHQGFGYRHPHADERW